MTTSCTQAVPAWSSALAAILSKRELNQFDPARRSAFVDCYLAANLFEKDVSYYGLANQMETLGRNHFMSEAASKTGLISADYQFFTNALRPVSSSDPLFRHPKERVIFSNRYIFTFEFDAKGDDFLPFFKQQLGWFRYRNHDTNCPMGKVYKALSDYADFVGVVVNWSGNKSFHIHIIFDPTLARDRFALHDINPRDGFVKHWLMLKGIVMNILRPCLNGRIIEPDEVVRFPEWYRRLPTGSRLVHEEGHALGLELADDVPQCVMWEKLRTNASGAKLFFRPEPFHDSATAERRSRNRSAKGPSFSDTVYSGDELAFFEGKLRTLYPEGSYPEFVRLQKESGVWTARFANSEGDDTPASVMTESHNSIMVIGKGAGLIDTTAIRKLEFPLLAMMKLWRSQMQRQLLALSMIESEATGQIGVPSGADAAVEETDLDTVFEPAHAPGSNPLELDFALAATSRNAARRATTTFFEKALPKTPFLWVKGPEGGGKSTSLMNLLPWMRDDLLARGKPTSMMFAFTDYRNAEEKCTEFNESCDPSLVGVVLPSFSRLYSRVCERFGAHPFGMETAAQQGCASVWSAIVKFQPEILDEFKAEHAVLWSQIGTRSPVFFTVHDVAQGWKGNTPTRAMWAPEFWTDANPKNRTHRAAMELGLLVHDEVSVDDIVDIERKEIVDWVATMVGSDAVWRQPRMSLRKVLKAYKAFVKATGHPKVNGRTVEISFERARLLAGGTGAEWRQIVVSASGAYPANGSEDRDLYHQPAKDAHLWLVRPKLWWRGWTWDGSAFSAAHRVVVLTTEMLPTAVMKASDKLWRIFSLETPNLPRDEIQVILRKGVTGANMMKTCAEVRDDLEADLKRPVYIVSNKVKELTATQSHVSARGSNQYRGQVVLQSMGFLAPEEHEKMLVLNGYTKRDDCVLLRHLDTLNQTAGRNLGFRKQDGAHHVLIAHPRLFIHIAAEGGFSYSRYDLVALLDAKKRWKLRAQRKTTQADDLGLLL